MIDRIWGLKQQWQQVNGHVWFHRPKVPNLGLPAEHLHRSAIEIAVYPPLKFFQYSEVTGNAGGKSEKKKSTRGSTMYQIDYVYIICIATDSQTKSAFLSQNFNVESVGAFVIGLSQISSFLSSCYSYCLHLNFAWIHNVIFYSCQDSERVLNAGKKNCPDGQWSMCTAGKPRVAGSIPGGDIYFHLEFFACFPSLHVGRALANGIRHDHSPVVIVVLDPRYNYSYKVYL